MFRDAVDVSRAAKPQEDFERKHSPTKIFILVLWATILGIVLAVALLGPVMSVLGLQPLAT